MTKITFSTDAAWRDIRGKHARIEIYRDGKTIGLISGELDCGIGPGMAYRVSCEGVPLAATFYKLNKAKAYVRDALAKEDNDAL